MAWRDIGIESLNEMWNLSVSGICHVGAHNATEISTYRQLFGNVPVTFIEANKDLEDDIKNSLSGFDNVEYRIVAAGAKSHIADIYIDTDDRHSTSLLKPHKVCSRYSSLRFHDPIEVQVDTLDSIMAGKHFNFLNIDVQGYELEVFKGATKSLENVDYILSEVNKAELYKGCPMIEDIDEFLRQFSFSRVQLEWYTGREDWGDALYIKKAGSWKTLY